MRILPFIALLMIPAGAAAQPPAIAQPAAVPVIDEASKSAAAAVDSFHAALARGDTSAALALLADDALIFESGEAERSKAEYAGHHLGADAAFSKAVPARLTGRTARADGGLAWVASERRVKGTYNGKAMDRQMTETMVLRRVPAGWQITHIHWSSSGTP